MKGPLGMALALRSQNWVSPSLGSVMGRVRRSQEWGAGPAGCLGPEGDSGCRPVRAFVQCTGPSWAMTSSRLNPLAGEGR